MTVLDNGKVVGEIGTGGELTWERSAGPMTLSLAPSWMAVKETNPPVAVTVEAGKVYEYFVVLGRDHYFVLADEMWPGERMHRQ